MEAYLSRTAPKSCRIPVFDKHYVSLNKFMTVDNKTEVLTVKNRENLVIEMHNEIEIHNEKCVDEHLPQVSSAPSLSHFEDRETTVKVGGDKTGITVMKRCFA